MPSAHGAKGEGGQRPRHKHGVEKPAEYQTAGAKADEKAYREGQIKGRGSARGEGEAKVRKGGSRRRRRMNAPRKCRRSEQRRSIGQRTNIKSTIGCQQSTRRTYRVGRMQDRDNKLQGMVARWEGRDSQTGPG